MKTLLSISATGITALTALPALAHVSGDIHANPHLLESLLMALNLTALSAVAVFATLATRRVLARRRK